MSVVGLLFHTVQSTPFYQLAYQSLFFCSISSTLMCHILDALKSHSNFLVASHFHLPFFQLSVNLSVISSADRHMSSRDQVKEEVTYCTCAADEHRQSQVYFLPTCCWKPLCFYIHMATPNFLSEYFFPNQILC